MVWSAPCISPSDRAAIGDLLAKGLLRGLNFSTPDLEGTFDRVLATGAEVVQEPLDQAYGRDCAFPRPGREHDPDHRDPRLTPTPPITAGLESGFFPIATRKGENNA